MKHWGQGRLSRPPESMNWWLPKAWGGQESCETPPSDDQAGRASQTWGQRQRTENHPSRALQAFTKTTASALQKRVHASRVEKSVLRHRKLGSTLERREHTTTQPTGSKLWTWWDLPWLESWWWATKHKRYLESPGCLDLQLEWRECLDADLKSFEVSGQLTPTKMTTVSVHL